MSVFFSYTQLQRLQHFPNHGPSDYVVKVHAFIPSIHMDCKAEKKMYDPYSQLQTAARLQKPSADNIAFFEIRLFCMVNFCEWYSLKRCGNSNYSSVHLNLKQEKGRRSTARTTTRTPIHTLSCILH